jgi:hypothetical protein
MEWQARNYRKDLGIGQRQQPAIPFLHWLLAGTFVVPCLTTPQVPTADREAKASHSVFASPSHTICSFLSFPASSVQYCVYTFTRAELMEYNGDHRYKEVF